MPAAAKWFLLVLWGVMAWFGDDALRQLSHGVTWPAADYIQITIGENLFVVPLLLAFVWQRRNAV